jgi:hypothetical protein
MKNQPKQPTQPFKDEKIELSESQSNPFLADPDDFPVTNELSFSKQEGKNLRENDAMSSRSQKTRTKRGDSNKAGGTRDGKKSEK